MKYLTFVTVFPLSLVLVRHLGQREERGKNNNILSSLQYVSTIKNYIAHIVMGGKIQAKSQINITVKICKNPWHSVALIVNQKCVTIYLALFSSLEISHSDMSSSWA